MKIKIILRRLTYYMPTLLFSGKNEKQELKS